MLHKEAEDGILLTSRRAGIFLFTGLSIGVLGGDFLAGNRVSAQSNPPKAKPDPEKKQAVNRLVPLALPILSSDLGFGIGGAVVYTVNRPDVQPYKAQFQLITARTDLGFELYTIRYDQLGFAGTSFRLKAGVISVRDPNRRYYGYGNRQFPGRNRDIEQGRRAVGGNIPERPDAIRGEEFSLNTDFIRNPAAGINPGRRILRESQNKYFRHDFRNTGTWFNLSDVIGRTKLQWELGPYWNRVTIDSYQGDREERNTVPNLPTLLDLERPTGYDAVEKPRFVNGIRAKLFYDTVPRAREVHPNAGFVVGIGTEASGPAMGSNYSFQRHSLFWYHYFELFREFFHARNEELILAWRLLAHETHGNIPFFHEKGLGGRYLRGYPARQFVDRVLVASSLELRYTFARFGVLGGSDLIGELFFDQGRVAPTRREIANRDWHRAMGVGLGLLAGGNALLEFTVGRSRFETYFELSFGHAFLPL